MIGKTINTDSLIRFREIRSVSMPGILPQISRQRSWHADGRSVAVLYQWHLPQNVSFTPGFGAVQEGRHQQKTVSTVFLPIKEIVKAVLDMRVPFHRAEARCNNQNPTQASEAQTPFPHAARELRLLASRDQVHRGKAQLLSRSQKELKDDFYDPW